MTVLVTGGAGYIGSHMVQALVEAGESVAVIDNLSTGFSAFLPEGVPLFIGDAGDENLVEGVIAAHGVESIIHFAGSVVVPDSMRDCRPAASIRCFSSFANPACSGTIAPTMTAVKSGKRGNSRHIASTNTSLPFCARTRTKHPIA